MAHANMQHQDWCDILELCHNLLLSQSTGVTLYWCHTLLVLLTCSAVGSAPVSYNLPVCDGAGAGAGGAAYDL